MNAVTKMAPARRARAAEIEATVSALGGPLLTIAEVSAWVKMHRATIYRLIKAGTFPPGKAVGANTRRWTRAEIKAWESDRG